MAKDASSESIDLSNISSTRWMFWTYLPNTFDQAVTQPYLTLRGRLGNIDLGRLTTLHPRHCIISLVSKSLKGQDSDDLVSLLYDSTSIMFWIEKINRSKATCSLFFMTTMTLSTFPYKHTLASWNQSSNCTHKNKFFANSFHSAGDVLVQSRMAGLKHRCVELFPADKKIHRVYLSYI